MSLAHIRAPSLARKSRKPAIPPAPGAATGPTAHCGASREPLYRTVNEASESGLEICDTCLAVSRRGPRAT
jgi:hypothetical protein